MVMAGEGVVFVVMASAVAVDDVAELLVPALIVVVEIVDYSAVVAVAVEIVVAASATDVAGSPVGVAALLESVAVLAEHVDIVAVDAVPEDRKNGE